MKEEQTLQNGIIPSLASPTVRTRHIEFIGNSLTCGYGVAGKADNEHMDEKGHRNLAAAIYDKIIKKYESHYVAV